LEQSNTITSRYAKNFQLYQDLNDKKLRVFLKKLRGKVLDAGCGDGRFIEYADVGVDFSRGMLNRAKKTSPSEKLRSCLDFTFTF
jgi:SAM-dependent methyltransferase